MSPSPIDPNRLLADFKTLVNKTSIGPSVGEGKPRVKLDTQSPFEWVREYKTHAQERSIDLQTLLDKGHALPFYALGGIIMMINLMANVRRTHTKQWFDPLAQTLGLIAFALNFVRCVIAYKEKSGINDFAQKNKISDEQFKNIKEKFQKLKKQSNELDDKKWKEVEALFYDVGLRKIVCDEITESNLTHRIIRFLAAAGSPCCVISAALAIVAETGGEKIVPLHSGSSWLAIFSQVFSVAAAALGIPFYVELVKSTGPKLVSNLKLEKKCDKKLENRQASNSLNFNNLVRESILHLTKLHQRFKELMMRYLTIWAAFIDLPVLVAWGVLELMGMREKKEDLPYFLPSQMANFLHEPLLWLFFIEASLNVKNFLNKSMADLWRYYKARGPRNALLKSSKEEDGAPDVFQGSDVIKKLASTDKRFGLWSLVHAIKQAQDNDLILKEIKDLTGMINDDVVTMIRKSSNTPQVYEMTSYLFARNHLNALDEV